MNVERSIDGQPTFLYTAGPAAGMRGVLLFIHGAAHDHSVWTLPCRHFARLGYRVLAPDLPGHGRSGGTPLASIPALADWAAQLLLETEEGPATAIGHSMGSLVALALAARHPRLVTRLALLGTAVPMPVSESLLATARNNEAQAHAMINTWSFSPRGQLGPSGIPGMWPTGLNRRLMERAAPGVLHTDLAACNAFSEATLADGVEAPALIIAGGRDQMTPPKAARALALQLGGARLEIIGDAGHGMLSERPNQVLDALRSFIL